MALVFLKRAFSSSISAGRFHCTKIIYVFSVYYFHFPFRLDIEKFNLACFPAKTMDVGSYSSNYRMQFMSSQKYVQR